MRFEKVKRGRKDNKIQRLIDQFLETKYDKVEVFNEHDYESNAQMVAAMRFVIRRDYADLVNVSKTGDRVFLYRVTHSSDVTNDDVTSQNAL